MSKEKKKEKRNRKINERNKSGSGRQKHSQAFLEMMAGSQVKSVKSVKSAKEKAEGKKKK